MSLACVPPSSQEESTFNEDGSETPPTSKRKWYAPAEVAKAIWKHSFIPAALRRRLELKSQLVHRPSPSIPRLYASGSEDDSDSDYEGSQPSEMVDEPWESGGAYDTELVPENGMDVERDRDVQGEGDTEASDPMDLESAEHEEEGQVGTQAESEMLYEQFISVLSESLKNGSEMPISMAADGAAETAGSDGAWMSDEINFLAQCHNIIRLKFAGGASFLQQWLDLSRLFQNMRKGFKGKAFARMRRGLKPAWHPLAMATIQKAGGMSLASVRTYSAALHALPAVASKYGTTTTIQAGFENSYPFNIIGQLDQWPGFVDLDESVAREVISRMPQLVALYANTVNPEDFEVEAIFEGASLPPRVSDTKLQAANPINQSRAMVFMPDRLRIQRAHWNQVVAAAKVASAFQKARSKQEAKEEREKIAKQKQKEKEKEKAAKQISATAAKTARAEEKKRERIESASKKPPKKGKKGASSGFTLVSCGNIACEAVDACGNDDSWTTCGVLGCTVRVCASPACQEILGTHKKKQHLV